MRTNRMNYDTLKELSNFIKEEEKKKVKATYDSTTTINNLRNEIISTTASKFSTINNEIDCVKNEIEEIKGRVTTLEVTAADRLWSPKQNHKKLVIKVRV